MLSKEALKWLESIEYQKFTHEQRMILLKAAMIAYPDKSKEEEK